MYTPRRRVHEVPVQREAYRNGQAPWGEEQWAGVTTILGLKEQGGGGLLVNLVRATPIGVGHLIEAVAFGRGV